MRFAIIPLVCIAALLSASATEGAPKRSAIGTLTCSASTTKNLTSPVSRRLSCSFERFGAKARQSYEGEIIHHGPNLTMRSEEVLVWNVWALGKPTGNPSLTGKYFGLREDDPSTPGLGANTLVGGHARAVLLEPVVNPGTTSAPGQLLTVTELELRPARI